MLLLFFRELISTFLNKLCTKIFAIYQPWHIARPIEIDNVLSNSILLFDEWANHKTVILSPPTRMWQENSAESESRTHWNWSLYHQQFKIFRPISLTMKHLLKTGYLNIYPPDNSNVKCAITACQNDSENLYVASYLSNGELTTRDTPVRVTGRD